VVDHVLLLRVVTHRCPGEADMKLCRPLALAAVMAVAPPALLPAQAAFAGQEARDRATATTDDGPPPLLSPRADNADEELGTCDGNVTDARFGAEAKGLPTRYVIGSGWHTLAPAGTRSS
jgi:hypothetical protein